MDINYKNAHISVRTEEFGNGTAVEVHVNGEKVLDLHNANALCINERTALDRGFQFGRNVVDFGAGEAGKLDGSASLKDPAEQAGASTIETEPLDHSPSA